MNISGEKYHFAYIKDKIPELSIRNFQKSESPDFLSTDLFTPSLGVELVEIVTKRDFRKNMKIKLYSLAEQICDEACVVFDAKYGIPLNVGIDFYENLSVSKSDILRIGTSIAEVVKSQINDCKFDESFHKDIDENLPEYLREICISFYPHVKQSVWYYPYSEIVPNLERNEIEECLIKKERLIKYYRQHADILYLVIIEGRIPSWHDDISIALSHQYQSSFDKVFLYSSVENEIFEIKIVH